MDLRILNVIPMSPIQPKEITNGKITTRFRQGVALIVVILVGILISMAFNV